MPSILRTAPRSVNARNWTAWDGETFLDEDTGERVTPDGRPAALSGIREITPIEATYGEPEPYTPTVELPESPVARERRIVGRGDTIRPIAPTESYPGMEDPLAKLRAAPIFQRPESLQPRYGEEPDATGEIPVVGGLRNVAWRATEPFKPEGTGEGLDVLNAIPPSAMIPTVVKGTLNPVVKIGLGLLGQEVLEGGARAAKQAARVAGQKTVETVGARPVHAQGLGIDDLDNLLNKLNERLDDPHLSETDKDLILDHMGTVQDMKDELGSIQALASDASMSELQGAGTISREEVRAHPLRKYLDLLAGHKDGKFGETASPATFQRLKGHKPAPELLNKSGRVDWAYITDEWAQEAGLPQEEFQKQLEQLWQDSRDAGVSTINIPKRRIPLIPKGKLESMTRQSAGIEPPRSKEPWEMTREEWTAFRYSPDISPGTTGEGVRAGTERSTAQRRMRNLEWLLYNVPYEVHQGGRVDHKMVIQKALAEGKPVPPEVLAEYPDLKAPTPAAPEAPSDARPSPLTNELTALAGETPGPVAQQADLGLGGSAKPLFKPEGGDQGALFMENQGPGGTMDLPTGKPVQTPLGPQGTLDLQGTAKYTGVTTEASGILETLDTGGVPSYLTNNAKRVLGENGITVTDTMTPNEAFGLLRQKATVAPQVAKAHRTRADLDALSNSALQQEAIELPKTHVSGLGAGQQEFQGTYLSTELANRYMAPNQTLWDATVTIKNPRVFRNATEYNAFREQFLPEGKTLEDIGDKEFFTLAQKATEALKKQGYDGVYLPESQNNEGILVVFDTGNVQLSNQRLVTNTLIREEEARARAGLAKGAETPLATPKSEGVSQPPVEPGGTGPLTSAEIRAAGEAGIPLAPDPQVVRQALAGGGVLPPPVDEALSQGKIWARPLPTADLIGTYTPTQTPGTMPMIGKVPGLSHLKVAVEHLINPSAVADDVVKQAIIIHNRILDVGEHGLNAGMNYLDRLTKPFLLDGSHRVTHLPGTPALSDVLDSPGRFRLTTEEREWADTVAAMVADASKLAEENGISLRKLGLEPGRRYIPRVVEAIRGLQKEVYSGAGGRIGAKGTHQKPRIYDWMEDGILKGVDYSDPVTAMQHYVRSLYKMVADKRFAEILNPLGETIAERMPPGVVQAAKTAKDELHRAKQLRAAIHRAYRGERLPDPTIASIGRSYPAEAAALKAAGPENPALQPIEAKATLLIEQARNKYYQAVGERARIRERVALPGQRESPLSGKMVNETYLQQPFAGGRIFTEDVRKSVDAFYGDQGAKWLKWATGLSNIERQAATTIDVATPLLQGLAVLGQNPKTWAKATYRSFAALANPQWARQYFGAEKNFTAAREMVEAGTIFGSSEYTEAGRQLGPIARKLGTTGRVIEKVGQQTIGRFQEAFTTYLDASALEMWKALKPVFEREGQPLTDLAEYINHTTGRISLRGIGVGATQRQIESTFVFFSPRYTRAGFALVSDAVQGNLKGQLARNTLAGIAGTGLLMYVGAGLALGKTEQEIEDGLTLTKNGKFNSRFLTHQVGTDHVGVGSFWYSFVRLLAGATATAMTDPKDFLSADTYDNPILGWLRSRSAPMGGVAWNILSGRTYLGERLDTPLSHAGAAAKGFAPMWAEGYILQEPRSSLASLPANLAGGRVFPMSPSELRNERSDEVAAASGLRIMSGERAGQPAQAWADLNRDQQRHLVEQNPDLAALIEKAQERNLRFAKTKADNDTNSWYAAEDRAKAEREQELTPVYAAFREGRISGVQFREARSTAMTRFAISLDQAKKDFPEARVTREERDAYYRAQGLALKEGKPEDILAEQYYSIEPKKDANGLEDMPGFYKERDLFLKQLDTETRSYIIEQYPAKRFADPEMNKLEKDYQKAQETLKPYWEIPERYFDKYPKAKPQVEEILALDQQKPERKKLEAKYARAWDAYSDYVEREHIRLRLRSKEVQSAGQTWGYWGPVTRRMQDIARGR